MATNTVLYLPSNATALKLLTAIYKNPAIKLQGTTDVLPTSTSINRTVRKVGS